jgi:hypothetical protein
MLLINNSSEKSNGFLQQAEVKWPDTNRKRAAG